MYQGLFYALAGRQDFSSSSLLCEHVTYRAGGNQLSLLWRAVQTPRDYLPFTLRTISRRVNPTECGTKDGSRHCVFSLN